MKRQTFLISLVSFSPLFAAFTSCSKKVDVEILKVKTFVTGRVYDIERGIPINNYKIVLERTWGCTSVVQAALCTEFIDSVRTNANGGYSFAFEAIPNATYSFSVDDNVPLYTESQCIIKTGTANIIDINAWRSTILKLNLDISNNSYAPLRVKNSLAKSDWPWFGSESIFETNISKTIYLESKPNSNINIMFYYTTGNSTNDLHSKTVPFSTTLQDTIPLNFKVDCKTF